MNYIDKIQQIHELSKCFYLTFPICDALRHELFGQPLKSVPETHARRGGGTPSRQHEAALLLHRGRRVVQGRDVEADRLDAPGGAVGGQDRAIRAAH